MGISKLRCDCLRILLMFTALVVAACSDGSEKLVGRWQLEETGTVFEFREDGKAMHWIMGQTWIAWRLEDNLLIFAESDTFEIVELTTDRFVMVKDSYIYSYKRISDSAKSSQLRNGGLKSFEPLDAIEVGKISTSIRHSTLPIPLHMVEAECPDVDNGKDGFVHVAVTVNTDGISRAAKVSKSNLPVSYRESALAASLLWKWEPGKNADGKRVESEITVPFSFSCSEYPD